MSKVILNVQILASARMGLFSDKCKAGDRCDPVGSRSLIDIVG
jgi:hypothetical protein